MGLYVGQVLRSHKGRGPDRVQVIAIRGDKVRLRYLSRRRANDFDLPLAFLPHPSCGWVPDTKGAGSPNGGGKDQ